jgi:hypothetical protein
MTHMRDVLLLFSLMCLLGCMNTEDRFERIDGDKYVALPLKLDGLYGLRDGALVKAEARFVDGGDMVTMYMTLFLRPPAEFQSGTYQAVIGGKMNSGTVECPSLTFQGGQTALPTVGGVFILKDESNRPLYRVRIPATTLTGRKKL